MKPLDLIAVPEANRRSLLEVMDALSLCVRVGNEFRFPSLMPRFESLPSLASAYGMRFHLVHVPGVQYQIEIPLVFFHKLSMLIAHATSNGDRSTIQSMDLRSNGLVLTSKKCHLIVFLDGPNLFVLVEGNEEGEQLITAYSTINGIPSSS